MDNNHFYSSSKTYSVKKFQDGKGNIVTQKIGKAEIDENGDKKYYVIDDNNKYVEVTPKQYDEVSPIIHSKPIFENLPSFFLFNDEFSPMIGNSYRPLLGNAYKPTLSDEVNQLRKENRRLRKMLHYD